MKTRTDATMMMAAAALTLLCAAAPAAANRFAAPTGGAGIAKPMSPAAASAVKSFLNSPAGAGILDRQPALRGVMSLRLDDPAHLRAMGQLGARLPRNFAARVAAASSPKSRAALAARFEAAYAAAQKPAADEILERGRGFAALAGQPDFDVKALEKQADSLSAYALYGPAAKSSLASVRAAVTHAKSFRTAEKIAAELLSRLNGAEGREGAAANEGNLPRAVESRFRPLARSDASKTKRGARGEVPLDRRASEPVRAKIAWPVVALAAGYAVATTVAGAVALIGTISASAMVTGLLFIAGGLAILSLYPVMLAPIEKYPALGLVLVPAALSLFFAPLLLTGPIGALSSAIAPLASISDLALLGSVAAATAFFGFVGTRVLGALNLAPASLVSTGAMVLTLASSAVAGLGANLLLGLLPSTHMLAALAAAVHGGFFPSVLAGIAAILAAAATSAGAVAAAAAGGLGALIGSVDRENGWRLDFGGAVRGLAVGAAIGLGSFAWLSAGVTAGLILAAGVAAAAAVVLGTRLAFRRAD